LQGKVAALINLGGLSLHHNTLLMLLGKNYDNAFKFSKVTAYTVRTFN